VAGSGSSCGGGGKGKQLVLAHLNVAWGGLASGADPVDLDASWAKRAAQFDDAPAQVRVADSYTISQFQRLSRFFLGYFQSSTTKLTSEIAAVVEWRLDHPGSILM